MYFHAYYRQVSSYFYRLLSYEIWLLQNVNLDIPVVDNNKLIQKNVNFFI